MQNFARVVLGFVLALGVCAAAHSQGRVIEETLVVKDPTVAEPGKWKIGAAAEYWYVKADYKLVDQNGNDVGSSSLTFNQPGWNIYGAYGNVTVAATRRKGQGDYSATQNVTGGTATYSGPHESKDEEYTLRWLFPLRVASPYLIVGYAKTTLNETFTVTSAPAGTTFTCGQGTGVGAVLTRTTEYNGPLIGGGGIFPFSDRFGARADLRFKLNDGETRTNASQANKSRCDKTGSGLGSDFTATGYWNIIGGLNAQLGFKYQYLAAGSDVRHITRYGLFGMLGYTLEF